MPPSAPRDSLVQNSTSDEKLPNATGSEHGQASAGDSPLKAAVATAPQNAAAKTVRRFAPQPIETSTSSSHGRRLDSGSRRDASNGSTSPSLEASSKRNNPNSAHIRFHPQLVETTYGGNRQSSRQSSNASESDSNLGHEQRKPRKFAPVVLSTAKRSRRAADLNVPRGQDHRTEEGHSLHVLEHREHAGWTTREENLSSNKENHASATYNHDSSEGKRQVCPVDGSPPARPAAFTQSRQHSFRCPDLDTIESSESEPESTPSSTSGSPVQGSPITASDSSFNDFYKHATRIRESIDENVNHHYLQVEARKAAQRVLQEQALAAFPNSDYHEPVHHYVNDDQDSMDAEIEDRPVTWEGFDEEILEPRHRRESTNTPWERLELQQHAELLEGERNANRVTAPRKAEFSPWWKPVAGMSGQQMDGELRSMRDRARPPMLGREIVFPRCASPQPARFDVTQGCEQLRQQMSRSSEEAEDAAQQVGLWAAATTGKRACGNVSRNTSKRSAEATSPHGLWGGFCMQKETSGADHLMPLAGPTGLMTPAPRQDSNDPFGQSFNRHINGTSSRSGSKAFEADFDQSAATKLNNLPMLNFGMESDTLEHDYPDAFITQVFNYLSLGYPTLARPFDEELAKISRISISQLRQDDIKAKLNPRGYIRLGPDFEATGGDSGLRAEECVRWRALKLYIHEWAKQERNMVRVDAPGGNWATTNRRGSWAW